jgi:hypothetical protein
MAVTADHVGRVDGRRGAGFFNRMLERVSAARLLQARAIARPFLLSLDDEELKVLGYRRGDVRRWANAATSL